MLSRVFDFTSHRGAAGMNVDQRQRIEQEIARAAATGLIEAGYSISVFDSRRDCAEALYERRTYC